jgi:hypothetical protein
MSYFSSASPISRPLLKLQIEKDGDHGWSTRMSQPHVCPPRMSLPHLCSLLPHLSLYLLSRTDGAAQGRHLVDSCISHISWLPFVVGPWGGAPLDAVRHHADIPR